MHLTEEPIKRYSIEILLHKSDPQTGLPLGKPLSLLIPFLLISLLKYKKMSKNHPSYRKSNNFVLSNLLNNQLICS